MSAPYFERRGSQLSERSSANESAGGYTDTPTYARHVKSHSMATSVEFDGPNPFLDSQEPTRPQRTTWALPTDVFWERYGAALANAPLATCAGSSLRPLPHLKILSGAAAAFSPSTAPLPTGGSSADGFATAAGGHVEPWLLHALGPNLDTGATKTGHSTDRPRLLFQYKPYSQQDALALTPPEVAAVLEAVFGKLPDPLLGAAGAGGGGGGGGGLSGGGTPSPLTPPGGFLSPAGTPSGGGSSSFPSALSSASDTAAVVLIKLIIDMYLRLGPQAAFPLVLYMLQRPLLHATAAGRCRVFDLIANLAVHGELLHAAPADEVPEDDDEVTEAVAGLDRSGPSADWRTTVTSALRASLAMAPENIRSHATPRERTDSRTAAATATGREADRDHSNRDHTSRDSREHTDILSEEDPTWPPLPRPAPSTSGDPRLERFRQWLRLLLYRLLSMLCSADGVTGTAWAAGLSCLVALGTFEGQVVRSYIEELPLNVVAALLEHGREKLWPESLMCWLSGLAANLLYVSAPQQAAIKTTNGGGTYRARSGGARPFHQQRPSYGQGHVLEVSFSNSAQIDPARLEAFGGTSAVARWFRLAPTLRSRRAFFCVLYDCAVGSSSGGQSLSRSFNGQFYEAEIASLGGVLLQVRAADAVHAIATSGYAGSTAGSFSAAGTSFAATIGAQSETLLFQDVADHVCAQMTAAGLPIQPEIVDECFSAIEIMLSRETVIPQDLEASFQGTLTELRGGSSAQNADWDALEDALRDTSTLGKSIAGSWLLQVLITAAEREVSASFKAGKQPPALLPAPDIRTASWKAREIVAMSSCPGLKRLLADVLPDPGGAAADAFILAVKGLLDHLRLRAAAASELGVAVAPLNTSSSIAGIGMSATKKKSATPWSAVNAPSVALSTLIIAVDWLALVPAPVRRPAIVGAAECLVSWLLVRKLDDSTYTGQEDALLSGIGAHDNLNGSATLAHIHAPHEGGGGRAGLGGGSTPNTPSSPFSAEASGGTAGGGAGGAVGAVGAAAGGAVSSLSKLVPVPKLAAAWRRFTAPHAARPRPPTASGNNNAHPEPLVRPLSAGMAAIGGAPVPGSAAELHTALPPTPEQDPSLLLPYTDALGQQTQGGEHSQVEQRRQDQRALTGGHSLFDAAAERAAEKEAFSTEAAQVAASALAEVEAGVGAVGSFIEGLSGCPVELLKLTEPGYLRAVFDALRPAGADFSYYIADRHTPSPSPPWAGRKASAMRGGVSSAAPPAAANRLCAVQAGRPLWDARAAVLALLLARCSLGEEEREELEETSGRRRNSGGGGGDRVSGSVSNGALDAMFLSSLLADADVRVRRQASVYVLQRLSQQGVGRYRAAMRAVVAKAQRAGDERLLLSPEAQVQALGEMRLLHLETLA